MVHIRFPLKRRRGESIKTPLHKLVLLLKLQLPLPAMPSTEQLQTALLLMALHMGLLHTALLWLKRQLAAHPLQNRTLLTAVLLSSLLQ